MERLKLKIKPSFAVFMAVAIVFKQGYFATLYSFAMILHEIAHYFVAKRLFYRCKEIQVGVFGAVLYGEFDEVAGSDRIKIALAGPLCNLALCLTCLACWWIFPETYYFTEQFFAANVSMAVVNLLPCYPLDGGRVLTGICEKRRINALKLTKIFTHTLSCVFFAVFVVSLFSGQNLFSVGLFSVGLLCGVFTQSGGYYVRGVFARQNKRFLKKGMEKKTLVFNEKAMLCDVVRQMKGNYAFCLEVVDENFAVKRVLDCRSLEKAILSLPPNTVLQKLSL